MRICLVLEGSYPYVYGGVSTWMHSCIRSMPEHEFVLWVIGANAKDRGRFVYALPPNVVEVHEVFLDDALRLRGEAKPQPFTEEEQAALEELVRLGSPDWAVLFRLFGEKRRTRWPFCRAGHSCRCSQRSARRSTPTRPLRMRSTRCDPCCCQCSICSRGRCPKRTSTMPSAPATAGCWPAGAAVPFTGRCC